MTRVSRAMGKKTEKRRKNYSAAMLDTLIEEATVDAYDESEQKTGFFTMLENHLATPFATEVLGTSVIVKAIEMTDDEEIVAMCVRDQWHQPIRVLELPLPDPPPTGAEWIEAYRRWACRR
jgi:hypothetical protein